jgi:hypothetical protein
MSDHVKLRDELLQLIDDLERSIEDDDLDGARRAYASTDEMLRQRADELVPHDRDVLLARTQAILERVLHEASEVKRALAAVQRSARAQAAYAIQQESIGAAK